MNICRLYLNSLDEAVQLMIIKAGKALKFLSFFLFIPSGGCVGGGGWGRRGKRGEEVGSIAKTLSLKCFQTAPANMRSVTSQLVVFTYSHFN